MSARLSRLRKKDYVSLLEGRVAALKLFVQQKRGEHAAWMSTTLDAQRSKLLAAVLPLAYKSSPTPEEDAILIGECVCFCGGVFWLKTRA